jgi:hypothetical protein
MSRIFEESCVGDTMGDLYCLLASNLEGDDNIVNVHSKEFYEEIKKIMDKNEVYVETKYKTMAKKVKPVALPLPFNCEEKVERAFKQLNLRDSRKVRHEFIDIALYGLKVGNKDFLTESEQRCFKEMILCHGREFAFELHKIGCVDPTIVAPMVIFTIPH